MRRWLIALLAVTLALSWVPLKAAQAASIIKTEDGLEFKFGLVEKVQFYTMNGADFTDNVKACGGKQCAFRSFVSPDTNIQDSTLNIFNFTNLLFDLGKGPVSIHINLENEARVDENVVDVNHLNLERAALTYKTPGFGDLVVGFDVHLFDPEGGLVYQDEDPGIWLVGSQGIFSWNFGYHKRLSRNGGKPLGNIIGGFTPTPGIGDNAHFLDRDTDILEARVGFNLGVVSISPLFLAVIRHTLNEFTAADIASCPTGTCTGMPQTSAGRAEIYYPGVVVTSKIGPLSLTAEAVGQFGEMRELGPSFQAIYGKNSVDFSAFAVFAEIAMDLTAQGLGLTPYVNLDYRSGANDPTNSTLGGFVSQSDLTQALRKDGFRLQSIQSLGAVTLGNGGDDGWGFNTTGRGIGPTIGTILEGFNAATSTFNARWGKADNPGLIKISAGVLGKVNSMWDTHIGMSYMRYDTAAPVAFEAALNRDTRGVLTPQQAACPGAVGSGPRLRCIASTINVSEEMGVEFNFNVGYSPVPAFRIQPFVSVFVPFDAADNINALFLDSNTSKTAYTAGVEFRAQF